MGTQSRNAESCQGTVLDSMQNGAPEQLLAIIECETARIEAQTRQAIALLIGAARADAETVMVPEDTSAPGGITIDELERFAPQWERLVPDDSALRASIAHLLARRYRFAYQRIPAIRSALRLDDEAVRCAYETIHGRSLLEIYATDAEQAETPALEGAAAGPDVSTQRDIADEVSWIRLQKGDILIREGDEGDTLYIVTSGRLRATVRDENGKQRPVGEIGRGETVGEMALLTGERRSTTVHAVRDSEAVMLSRAGFERLVEKHPRALLTIVRVMAARVRRGHRTQRSGVSVTTIAVVPVGAAAPLGEFCRLLADALQQHGRTLRLSSRSLARYRQEEQPRDIHSLHLDSPESVVWLNEQESRYRYILYEADREATPWTRRCIRQADRLLLLAGAGDVPLGGEIEAQVREDDSPMDRELVLVHPETARSPSATRRWLDRWQVARYHHLRLGRDGDMKRLARSLAGRAVGLVLSGGGARCFAQIGAIRAFQEAEIPIDWVAGSSAGSVIAAEFALGWDWETILEQSRHLVAGRRGLLDVTVPVVSVLAAGRLSHALTDLFGQTQIEDLWLRYFCTSSNLATARLTIHSEGSLRRAVRASCALPGVVPPLLERGELLVDGGILDNLPVDVMKEFCDGGPVIAVDISAEFQLAKPYHFGEGISARQLLWNRANPFAKTKLVVPSIVNILLRTVELQAVRSRKEQQEAASLYIRPPVDAFGTFDTKPLDRLVEVGYRTAREKIAEWQAAGGPGS